MKIGLIARAENRGLGILTWEFFRHVSPAKTLVVNPGDPWPHERYFDRYPGAEVVDRQSANNNRVIDGFLAGLDVIYTAETPYLPSMFERARKHDVRSVLHVMPEFAPGAWRRLPKPDALWVPTPWRANRLPWRVSHVPVPVDRKRLSFKLRTRAEVFVHNAGTLPKGDRNGTRIVLSALRHLREPMTVILRSQVPLKLKRLRAPRYVEVVVEEADVPNYWDLYRSGDVFLLPRRYAGLSLPLNEAMSSGMAILASAVPPQDQVLLQESLITARQHGWVRTQRLQVVPSYAVSPRALAQAMDRLVQDPELVQRMSRHSDATAEALSWERWRERYGELLAHVS
jgi:glycosyltransferase involved in cell wall biosynthesis